MKTKKTIDSRLSIMHEVLNLWVSVWIGGSASDSGCEPLFCGEVKR